MQQQHSPAKRAAAAAATLHRSLTQHHRRENRCYRCAILRFFACSQCRNCVVSFLYPRELEIEPGTVWKSRGKPIATAFLRARSVGTAQRRGDLIGWPWSQARFSMDNSGVRGSGGEFSARERAAIRV
jgi:hypothetical protein